MAGRRASRDAITRERWAEQIAAIRNPPPKTQPTRSPISADRIVAAALAVIEAEGYEDLTMRRVATALQTGPASLYAHVRSKSELDDLLIGELCSRVSMPSPDANRWQEQFLGVCTQLRDQLLRYPGVSRAALGAVPGNLSTLRVGDSMLGLLLAGGVAPQTAAWASDAAFLYVIAYCLEAGIAHHQRHDLEGNAIDRDEIMQRLQMLPPELFPHTTAHTRELTAGDEHQRFNFTLNLMLRGLGS